MRPAGLRLSSILLLDLVLLFCASFSIAAELKTEEVISRHLESVGTPQARETIKSRAIQGTATYRVLVAGNGTANGKFQFASEGLKSDFLFRINANGFLGEQFICDGDKTSVAATYTDKHRSELGTFVLTQDTILHENLLGGIWSTAWPLLDADARKAKIHVEGMKRIDGKDLIALRYEPKKRTDLEIVLYFDPQTFQHVLTIYKLEPPTTNVGGELAQSGKSVRRYRLEEHFSDFKTADGLTLPNHYDLRYTFEAESGFSKAIEWEVSANSIANNMSIDPRAFQVQ